MDKINGFLAPTGRKFSSRARIRHLIDVLYREIGPEKISRTIVKRFPGIEAVVQYPCHVLFPSKIVGFEKLPGRPQMLEELTEALGFKVRRYSRELQCCGGAGGFTRGAAGDALNFTRKKLDAILKETKAECIVVSCITCLMHLDDSQKKLNKSNNQYSIPVLDYNQLLALCLGYHPAEVASISAIPRDKLIQLLS